MPCYSYENPKFGNIVNIMLYSNSAVLVSYIQKYQVFFKNNPVIVIRYKLSQTPIQTKDKYRDIEILAIWPMHQRVQKGIFKSNPDVKDENNR